LEVSRHIKRNLEAAQEHVHVSDRMEASYNSRIQELKEEFETTAALKEREHQKELKKMRKVHDESHASSTSREKEHETELNLLRTASAEQVSVMAEEMESLECVLEKMRLERTEEKNQHVIDMQEQEQEVT